MSTLDVFLDNVEWDRCETWPVGCNLVSLLRSPFFGGCLEVNVVFSRYTMWLGVRRAYETRQLAGKPRLGKHEYRIY